MIAARIASKATGYGSRAAAKASATATDAASAIRIGSSLLRRSEKRPRKGLTTVSTRPATRKTAPIANGVKPPSSSWSGTSTTSVPKSQAGSAFQPEPADEAPVGERAGDGAGCLLLGGGAGARRRPACEERRDGADDGEGGADPDGVGHGAEHRSEDGTEDGGAESDADQLAAALTRRRDGQPGEAPAQVVVLEAPWTNRASPKRPGALGGGEGEAGAGEKERGRRRRRS